jgi:hypothetical protein
MLELPQVPLHLTHWDEFVHVFKAWWTDPNEAEKALDTIMRGRITQKTSVKLYNDLFNETMNLSGENGINKAILHAYMTGLKPSVNVAAVAVLNLNPQIDFTVWQALMVQLDEQLMQSQTEQTRPGPRNYVPNFPAPAVVTPVGHASPTPAPHGQTPIKAETAWQYTRLTDSERAYLSANKGCFRCRQINVGHVARTCLHGQPMAIAATEVSSSTPSAPPAYPAPLPAPSAPAMPMAPMPLIPAPAANVSEISDFCICLMMSLSVLRLITMWTVMFQ